MLLSSQFSFTSFYVRISWFHSQELSSAASQSLLLFRTLTSHINRLQWNHRNIKTEQNNLRLCYTSSIWKQYWWNRVAFHLSVWLRFSHIDEQTWPNRTTKTKSCLPYFILDLTPFSPHRRTKSKLRYLKPLCCISGGVINDGRERWYLRAGIRSF